MRFLFSWQHVEPSSRLTGVDGLRAVLESLDGFELAADAWERAILPDRIDGYQPSMLDTLCLTGEVGWARLSPSSRDATQLVGATPVALFLREHAERWATLAIEPDAVAPALRHEGLQGAARLVADALRARGASFIGDLTAACGLDEAAVRGALGDLRRRRPGRVRRLRRPAHDRARVGRTPGVERHAQQRDGTLVAAASREALRLARCGARPRRKPRDGRRAPGAHAAQALRRRLPPAARARGERRALARADARLPPARGARRNPRRPFRVRHVGRTVRARRCDRAAARDPAHAARRPLPRQSAPPIR